MEILKRLKVYFKKLVLLWKLKKEALELASKEAMDVL